jgi:hypothetical protein
VIDNKLEGYTKFNEVAQQKLELMWIERISKLLVGKKIIKVEYMTDELAKEQGWYKRPIQILLNNGIGLHHQWMMRVMTEGHCLLVMMIYQLYQ